MNNILRINVDKKCNIWKRWKKNAQINQPQKLNHEAKSNKAQPEQL